MKRKQAIYLENITAMIVNKFQDIASKMEKMQETFNTFHRGQEEIKIKREQHNQ